ncbi:uncharacterized protein [Amphiura filiformis]|uniref:uncharacterized protein n=1 Tax=Amphiura filiformis TaxID=82378 RepID=UPI003B226919
MMGGNESSFFDPVDRHSASARSYERWDENTRPSTKPKRENLSRSSEESSACSDDQLLGRNLRSSPDKTDFSGRNVLRTEINEYSSSNESDEYGQSLGVTGPFLTEAENSKQTPRNDLWEKRWRDVIRRLDKAERERAEIRKLLCAMQSRMSLSKPRERKSDKQIARSVYHDSSSSDSDLVFAELDVKSHDKMRTRERNGKKDVKKLTHDNEHLVVGEFDVMSCEQGQQSESKTRKVTKQIEKKMDEKKTKKVIKLPSELEDINYEGSDGEMLPRFDAYRKYQTPVQV